MSERMSVSQNIPAAPPLAVYVSSRLLLLEHLRARGPAIPLRQLLRRDERQQCLADGARAAPHYAHLGERRRGEDRLEDPEEPRHVPRHVHKELLELRASVS